MNINYLLILSVFCLPGITNLSVTAQTQMSSPKNSSYRLCDFHQHTTFTDGEYSMKRVFFVCDSIQLAWWSNSEHGGISGRNGLLSGLDTGKEIRWEETQIAGDIKSPGTMWRWQTIREYSFPYIVAHRASYSPRVLVQGMEWNVPGHEHASMSILSGQFMEKPNADAVSCFEYQFDNSDKDVSGGEAIGWKKSTLEGHAKALEGLAWLQKKYPKCSWVIPGHPDRKGLWSIADLRDCNNTAPDVFFGFEGIPGHQQSPDRGEYSPKNNTYGMHTYGGTGWMCARVGGVWDALLSEGRKWWIFSCSDFHNIRSDFYPGEYNKTYVYMPEKINPEKLADYLRAGNSFVVSGNFVNDLQFRINDKTMGETCSTQQQQVTLTLEVSQPKNTKLRLDHIDLIEGVVSGYQQPETAGYTTDSVSTTRIIHTFSKLNKDSNNKIQITYTFTPSAPHTYYRLRGTHHAPGTPGETDMEGNPLPDNKPNTRSMALNDQWFYSNPIFVIKGCRN